MLDRIVDFCSVGANVLLGRALERNFRAHNGRENSDLVISFADFEVSPFDVFGNAGRHITASFKQHWDTVRKAEDLNARLLHPRGANANAHFDNERVALKHLNLLLVSSDKLRCHLLLNAEHQIVLTCGTETFAVWLGKLQLVKLLVHRGEILLAELVQAHVRIKPEFLACTQRSLLVYAREVFHQKLRHGLLLRLRMQPLQSLQVDR